MAGSVSRADGPTGMSGTNGKKPTTTTGTIGQAPSPEVSSYYNASTPGSNQTSQVTPSGTPYYSDPIAQAQADWAAAKARGDTAGMAAAHAAAEAERAKQGYSGGADGSQYIPLNPTPTPSPSPSTSTTSGHSTYTASAAPSVSAGTSSYVAPTTPVAKATQALVSNASIPSYSGYSSAPSAKATTPINQTTPNNKVVGSIKNYLNNYFSRRSTKTKDKDGKLQITQAAAGTPLVGGIIQGAYSPFDSWMNSAAEAGDAYTIQPMTTYNPSEALANSKDMLAGISENNIYNTAAKSPLLEPLATLGTAVFNPATAAGAVPLAAMANAMGNAGMNLGSTLGGQLSTLASNAMQNAGWNVTPYDPNASDWTNIKNSWNDVVNAFKDLGATKPLTNIFKTDPNFNNNPFPETQGVPISGPKTNASQAAYDAILGKQTPQVASTGGNVNTTNLPTTPTTPPVVPPAETPAAPAAAGKQGKAGAASIPQQQQVAVETPTLDWNAILNMFQPVQNPWDMQSKALIGEYNTALDNALPEYQALVNNAFGLAADQNANSLNNILNQLIKNKASANTRSASIGSELANVMQTMLGIGSEQSANTTEAYKKAAEIYNEFAKKRADIPSQAVNDLAPYQASWNNVPASAYGNYLYGLASSQVNNETQQAYNQQFWDYILKQLG